MRLRIAHLLSAAALLVAALTWTPGYAADCAASGVPGVFTTTGTGTCTVPADWNDANNTVQVLGGGSNGLVGATGHGGAGGGSAAFSSADNVSMTPGATMAYRVGIHNGTATVGGTAPSWFGTSGTTDCTAASGAIVGAKGQSSSNTGAPATGCAGTMVAGTNGGADQTCACGGSGGAGAPGKAGQGGTGGLGDTTPTGGGGGGANGGTAGSGFTHGSGANGGGDGGDGGNGANAPGNGTAGTNLGSTGSGGGGGGSKSSSITAGGGSKGAGGGGAPATGTAGTGGNGVVYIAYTAAAGGTSHDLSLLGVGK